ncbi:hypothetical protein EMN47_07165 [Prolixibacteraceae bacterium JC049]|nr:hypothetical protein [Prolixibacteraceae bacterium JC049]
MKRIILILMLAVIGFSCDDDDPKTCADVDIVFYSLKTEEMPKLEIDLYSAEMPDLPLYEDIKPYGGKITFEDLNAGNYFIQFRQLNCWGSCTKKIAFQVNQGVNKEVNVNRNDYTL